MAQYADPVAERLSVSLGELLSPEQREALKTYNPNQQRGYGGRFGSGTGPAKPAPAPAKPGAKPAVPGYAVGFAGSGTETAAPKPKPTTAGSTVSMRHGTAAEGSAGPARKPAPAKPAAKPAAKPRKGPSAQQRQQAAQLNQQAAGLDKRASQLQATIPSLEQQLKQAQQGGRSAGSSASASQSATAAAQTGATAAGSTAPYSGSGSSYQTQAQQIQAKITSTENQIASLRAQANSLRQQATSLLNKSDSRRLLAKSLTADLEATVSFPIEKMETTPDGDILVYGKATDGTVDSDQQIVDPIWSAKAIDNWLSTGGNLRVQHNPHRDPAGVGLAVEVDRDGDGAHWLKALVVEPTAQKLVSKGALRAFSVGIMRPRVVADSRAPGGRIVGGELGEVSLVDRPANKNCAFTLVKSDKDGHPEYVGTMEGEQDVIDKMLAPSPMDVARSIQKRLAVEDPPELPETEKGFLPSIPRHDFTDPIAQRLADALRADAALVEKTQLASGRVVDSSGEDRSDMADEDFAGPNKTFPIETRDDVSDAASLAHHAKDPAAVRSRIRSIANRKWPDMELPPSLSGKGEDGECPTCHGTGKIMEGHRKCPDCGGTGKMTAEKGGGLANLGDRKAQPFGPGGKKKPKVDDEDEDDATKGDKEKDDEADDDAEGSDDVSGADAGDGGKDDDEGLDTDMKKGRYCSDCGEKIRKSYGFCPGCGGVIAKDKKPTKISVDGNGDKDGDGDGLFDADGDGDGAVATRVGKGRTPTSVAGGAEAKDSKPVAPHREPDGPEIEEFEADASLPTDRDDGKDMMSQLGWEKMQRESSAPYLMMRTHDAFCAAYDGSEVMSEYASMKSLVDALDVETYKSLAQEAAASGEMEVAAKFIGLYQAGELLATADAAAVADARASLHKGFTDMYPNVHLTPGECGPEKFQRPYISEGHARNSVGDMGKEPAGKIPPEARPASSFNRGPITSGHERPSPGSSGDNLKGFAPSRTYYSGAQRERLKQHMQAVHDKIAEEWPDLCPMSPNANPEPTAMAKGQKPEGQRKLSAVNSARRGMGVREVRAVKATAPQLTKAHTDPDVIKSVVNPELEALREMMEKMQQQLSDMAAVSAENAALKQQVGDLQKSVDILGSQPDPALAPYRSATQRAPGYESDPVAPAERRSLVDIVSQNQRDEKLRFLKGLASSGDPVMREQAEEQIRKMLA